LKELRKSVDFMETPQKKNEPNMYHSKKQSQHESMKLAPIFEGAKNGVH
jgi:hypothetical protein